MAATSNLVQYILIRKDLLLSLRWPIGAVIAQGCHASTAALQLFKDDLDTIEYLKDLDNMHKVVLEIPDETELSNLAKELNENSINHKLWYEQPEAIPTCIALKPYPRSSVKKYLSKYKLYKT